MSKTATEMRRQTEQARGLAGAENVGGRHLGRGARRAAAWALLALLVAAACPVSAQTAVRPGSLGFVTGPAPAYQAGPPTYAPQPSSAAPARSLGFVVAPGATPGIAGTARQASGAPVSSWSVLSAKIGAGNPGPAPAGATAAPRANAPYAPAVRPVPAAQAGSLADSAHIGFAPPAAGSQAGQATLPSATYAPAPPPSARQAAPALQSQSLENSAWIGFAPRGPLPAAPTAPPAYSGGSYAPAPAVSASPAAPAPQSQSLENSAWIGFAPGSPSAGAQPGTAPIPAGPALPRPGRTTSFGFVTGGAVPPQQAFQPSLAPGVPQAGQVPAAPRTSWAGVGGGSSSAATVAPVYRSPGSGNSVSSSSRLPVPPEGLPWATGPLPGPAPAAQPAGYAPVAPAAQPTSYAPAATPARVPSLSLLPAPAGGQSVRIGFIGPLSGAAAPYGTSCRKGIELALADAMSADTGGSPYRFELAAEDDAGDEVLAGNAAVKLVSDPQVSVVLGSVNSPSTHVAAKVTMLSGVPQITSVSTDPALTRLNNRWFFRNLADDAVQGAALARYFFDARGLRRIALVHDDNRYGKGGARIVEAEATRRGTPVVLLRQFARGTTDFTALADAIAASRPDGLIVWGLFGEAALICKAVAAKGLKLPIAGGDGLVSPSFVQEAGAAAEGVVVTYPFDPARNEPLTRSFVERFQAAYGHEPDSFAAHSYDAAFTVAAAIKQVGPERARVREALASLRSGNGVAGPGGFDVFGNATTPVQLAVIENGKFRLLGAAEVAAGGR